MKRILFGLLTSAVVAFGLNLSSASAAPIGLDPDPTASLNVSGAFVANDPILGFGTQTKTYEFTLTHDATASFASTLLVNASLAFNFLDITSTPVLLSNGLSAQLFAGSVYRLIVAATGANGLSAYDGNVTFTASAVTPIPPSLLLFVTAFGGLGVLGFRRRGLPTA